MVQMMIQVDNFPPGSHVNINNEHPKILEHKGNPSITSSSLCNPCIYILEMQHHIFKYLWKNNFSTPITERLEAGSMRVLEIGLAPELCLNEQSNLIKNMIRVLKPCGWIEFMIFNLNLYNSGPYTTRLTQAYDSYINYGRECNRIDEEQLYNMLVSTQRIQTIDIKNKRTLLGTSGGRIGELLCDVLLQPLKSHKSELCEYMGICIKEFDEMYIIMLQEINDYKTFCISHRIYAKKY
ncbi:4707_t:CDS:2 [Funneliformis geosporum]|uniref:4707_t:CDS:1 n=1 Tax=Funneliformis geosporum TaxID=1117311 RepID=A0A9W4SNE6_9GLOM|nr:4707_t:CDS:2 [Funneliformis geosporum]